MKNQEITSVAIIGAGTMGQGIAQVCALAGVQVAINDSQAGVAENALTSIRRNLTTLQEKGKLAPGVGTRASELLRASDIASLKADLAIEAVVEDLAVKKEILAAVEKVNGGRCILATNTSSIPVTQIAVGLNDPGRLAGLHFFNPAPVMKLVEIVKGSRTHTETVDALFAFTRRIGKEAVLTQDSPGFIVNRVARHYYVESLKVLEDGVADHGTIDALLRSTGFRMGAFELMDLIGVDVNFSVTVSMYNAFHQAPRFRPSLIQQQKVDAGHHGRKTGKGFYDYV